MNVTFSDTLLVFCIPPKSNYGIELFWIGDVNVIYLESTKNNDIK